MSDSLTPLAKCNAANVCHGCRGEGCYRCSDHGFQTKSQYERNPPELKAERK